MLHCKGYCETGQCWNRHEFGTEYPEQQGHIYTHKRTLTETQLMRE